ncbi:MAG: hypothetical protein QNL98_02565 [Mycobacterium sp.]
MDAAMMGLAGTVVGAAVVGGVGLVRSMADSWFPGVVANTEQRRQAQVDLQSRRHDVLREWRAGLAEARDTYRQWAAGPRDTDPPNVVGAEWFESLRPYLPGTGEGSQYRTALEVACDNPTVVMLSLEIGRIEKDWVDEVTGNKRRR